MAVYMITAGSDVLSGEVTLGAYTVMVQIIKQMGGLVQQGHAATLVILKSMKSLHTMTQFLSLEVDVPHRQRALRLHKQDHWGVRARVKKAKTDAPAGSPLKNIPSSDLMEIELFDVTVKYGTNKVLTNVSMSLKQGTITTIMGPHSAGKRTMIRALAHVLVPDEGSVFVPAHLRAVHLDRFPELVERLTLFQNLTYGGATEDQERPERVMQIMKDLIPRGAEESVVLDLLQKDIDGNSVEKWWLKLTQTDTYIIHLARALVLNVEFMVMERIMDMLNVEKARDVMRILRRHVDERGLYETSDISSRRPRTIIFATLSTCILYPGDRGKVIPEEVDSVWCLDMDGACTTHDLSRD